MNIKTFLIPIFLLSAVILTGAEKLPEIICCIYGNFTIHPENDKSLAELEQKFLIPMQNAGFNTVDLKIHDFTRSPELFQENLRKTAETVRKHGMQLSIYTYFPVFRKENSPFPAAVDGTGRQRNRFYNVLAPGLWHELRNQPGVLRNFPKRFQFLLSKLIWKRCF